MHTLTVSEPQRDVIRRGAATEAEKTAKALSSWFSRIEAGYPDKDHADHARESIESIMESLRAEVDVLVQVPWSDEEEHEAASDTAESR